MCNELEKYMDLTSCWEYMRNTDLPVFIYGMGDGCIKLLKWFEGFSIPCAGIFASDEFVRGHSFQGHKVHRLSEIEQALGDEFVTALAFGAGYKELIDKIDGISRRHKVFVPEMPVIGGGLFTKELLKKRWNDAVSIYNMLCDDKSKQVYKGLLEYKITGELDVLRRITTPPEEAFLNILKLGRSDIFADLGAYTGDTVLQFLKFTGGEYKKIYAFEPNSRNYRKLTETVSGMKNITALKAAAWDCDCEIRFLKGGGRMAKVIDSKEGTVAQARSLDSVLEGSSCTYIKYDVEGEEKRAIEGSEKTIRQYSPKLSVALYHRCEDIFDIPLQIYKLNPNYKFYIRHFPYYPAWDTNLFAV